MFWQFLVNVKTISEMSLELGHYRWCHTGYHYTHLQGNCPCCMAPSVIKNKGTPQMSSLKVLERERKYKIHQNDQLFKLDHLFNK